MEASGNPIIELALDRTGDAPYESGVICEPGSTVRIVIKAHYRIALKNPVLYTNYPRSGRQFDRLKFSPVEKQVYDGKKDWSCDLLFEIAGTYDYYLMVRDGSESHRCKSGTVLVMTQLMINRKPMPKRALCAQTVLTRSLGPLSTWKTYFTKASQLGYNTVHFTSLNELGQSRSAYSLRDQLAFAPDLFETTENTLSGSSSSTGPSSGEVTTLNHADQKAAVKAVLTSMEFDYGIMGIVDVVWNHTSADSPWLAEHPEATYNTENADHLKAAQLLDEALLKLSLDIAKGVYESKGLGRTVNDERSLTLLCQIIESEIFPALKLWEFFVVDVDNAVHEFEEALDTAARYEPSTIFQGNEVECLRKQALNRDSGWGRFTLKVDVAWAIKLFAPSSVRRLDQSKLNEKIAEYKAALNKVNLPLYEKLNEDLRAALSNIANRIRYERIDSNGPKLTEISDDKPLIAPYFTKIMAKSGRPFYAANNGWVWGANPSQNFADFPGSAYIRREVIVWIDLVKLRYGNQPSDSPWIWEHMKHYTVENAELFHGFRIDNCHSTPIAVARYMLDAARSVRPSLYVTAELFTGSEKYDNLFVAKLGINSLIREAMQVPDVAEFGRILHRYGGESIGTLVHRYPPSFYSNKTLSHSLTLTQSANITSTSHPSWVMPVKPTTPPAFLYDCTHDNQTPWQKRTAEDYLPNTALVSMARLPIGSVAGYDWIVTNNPHVDDPRLYPAFTESEMRGMMEARRFFNQLHYRLECEGYTQIHIHQEGDLITVQRHNPLTHKAVFCVAHTAFHSGNKKNKTPAKVVIPGTITKFSFCAKLSFDKTERDTFYKSRSEFKVLQAKRAKAEAADPSTPLKEMPYMDPLAFYERPDPLPIIPSDTHIAGFQDSELLVVDLDSEDERQSIFKVWTTSGSAECVQTITWEDFPPGSVLVLEARLPDDSEEALLELRQTMREALPVVSKLNQIDANYILFRCEAEEKATTHGARGVYGVPGYGDLVYAGLQGVVSVLEKVRATNDMGHALLTNLRTGNWLMDYIVARLENDPNALYHSEGVKDLGGWFKHQFALVRRMPRYLIPRCFDIVVMKAYYSIRYHVAHMAGSMGGTPRGNFVSDSSESLVQSLALCGIQMVGALSSVSLLDPKISGDEKRFRITMAAGLPHFSQGYMRAWGRDTFIAFRGLLLLPGRYEEAREILIGFAAALRHGLIPNLIDSGWNPRYNSRDATWWFLYALQCYCLSAPEGHAFLMEKIVPRLFMSDSELVHPGAKLQKVTMASVVQEIMERHVNGIHFRERNAGSQIDSSMSDRGFNVDITFDAETGFLFGGNASNCGTWMDKMGSNQHAGNRGVPATPRDGAAVELVGLLKSTTRWLAAISGSQPTPVQSSSRSGSLKLTKSASSGLTSSADSGILAPPPTSASPSPVGEDAARAASPALGAATGAGGIGAQNASLSSPVPRIASPVPRIASPVFSFPAGTGASAASSTHQTTYGGFGAAPHSGSPIPTAVNHDTLKFSAPPEELPVTAASDKPFAYPPPLFADAAKKNKETASIGLDDFFQKKKSAVSMPMLIQLPTFPGGPDIFPHTGVTIRKPDGTEHSLSYADWDARINANFEKCFYVPQDVREDPQYKLTRSQIARRSIYKDSYKSSGKYTDYQLRPNICIAMVVAPELFVPAHAAAALDQVEKHLLGPLGMRTLDPSDSHYRGYYDNANNSDDYYMANGFSYHMGPEWVWPMGYFLRARLQFRSKPPVTVLNQLQRILQVHREAVENSDWKGLPELTQKDGAFCPGSCVTQAWSASCILEALYDLHNY